MQKFTREQIRGMGALELMRVAQKYGVGDARALNDDALRKAVTDAVARAGDLEGEGPTGGAAEEQGPQHRPVRLTYGSHDVSHHLAGWSVQRVIDSFQEPMSMDPNNLRVYVNGTQVGRERWSATTLAGGETVEFHRPSGEKGA